MIAKTWIEASDEGHFDPRFRDHECRYERRPGVVMDFAAAAEIAEQVRRLLPA